ncbi:MAG: hypothetical protein GKR94_05035 [Gammaproteobacteria bacterium]|nr:hypothetical protein [Gammaproteobacteria bacterium]
MEVRGLDGAQMGEVFTYRVRFPKLSVNDSAALVMTMTTDDAVLLTGDATLRDVGEQEAGIPVRGVIWATDQLEEHELTTNEMLLHAYTNWLEDDLVRLSRAELLKRIRRLSQ